MDEGTKEQYGQRFVSGVRVRQRLCCYVKRVPVSLRRPEISVPVITRSTRLTVEGTESYSTEPTVEMFHTRTRNLKFFIDSRQTVIVKPFSLFIRLVFIFVKDSSRDDD